MRNYISKVSIKILTAFFAGCCYAFSFPRKEDFHIPLLTFVAITLLIFLWEKIFAESLTFRKRLIQSLLVTLAFSLGLNLIGYYWLPFTIYEFGGIAAPFNYFFHWLFTLIILPQYLIYSVLRSKFPKRLSPAVAALILTCLEYFIPQQFPGHFGHSWLSLAPYIGLASIGGAPLFSFISYYAVSHLVQFKKKNVFISVVTLSFFLAINIFLKIEPAKNNIEKLNVRIVQANVGNFLKIESESGDPVSISQVIQRYKDLSTLPSNIDLDLIIWPETAYPHSMKSEMMKTTAHLTPFVFKSIMSEMNAQLLIGAYDSKVKDRNKFNPYFENEYNVSMLFAKDGRLDEVYRKHRLIPFGETLPLGPFTEIASEYIQNVSYFAAGDQFTVFTIKDLNFITPICYEILYSSFIHRFFKQDKKIHFIVNHTNDSWYGDTAEPFQHLYLAKWRALEFQVPIIRATNTGITSVIYPSGKESERLVHAEQKKLDLELKIQKSFTNTTFAKFGFFVTIAFFLILFGIEFAIGLWQKNKQV